MVLVLFIIGDEWVAVGIKRMKVVISVNDLVLVGRSDLFSSLILCDVHWSVIRVLLNGCDVRSQFFVLADEGVNYLLFGTPFRGSV